MEIEQDKMGKRDGVVRRVPISENSVIQDPSKVSAEGETIIEKGDCPVSMKMERDSCSGGLGQVQVHDEEDLSTMEFEGMGQGHRSACCCQDEIKSLNLTVKQLGVQIEKQNKVIAGIKSCLRTVGLSFLAFGTDEEQVEDCVTNPAEFSEREQASGPGSADVDTELWKSSGLRVISGNQSTATQDNQQDGDKTESLVTIVNCIDNCSSSLNSWSAPAIIESPETTGRTTEASADHVNDEKEEKRGDGENIEDNDQDGIEAGPVFCLKLEEEEMCLVEFEEEDGSGDSFDVLEDKSEDDKVNQEKEAEGSSYHLGIIGCSITKSVKRKGDVNSQRVHPKKADNTTKRKKCRFCTRVFGDVSKLYRHIRSFHEGERYKCTLCPGTFNTLGNVQRHEKNVHQIGGPPTQQCKICGTHLADSDRSLANHMKHRHMEVMAEER